ncbi:class I SAM-dependent methyltransferase [Asaia prunellae]|uniref:class I SAM-dependent methyltransferase n=1 Tax=Asaia prunellae TaxID=610245 RepID=UPI0004721F18|nr:class I SAM-dependent methyltransferase [Asaia prunellae]
MSNFVTAHYDLRAQDYVCSAVHAAGADLDYLVTEVKKAGSRCVLDLGCGGGHVSYALAPHVDQVIACDPTRSMALVVQDEAQKRDMKSVLPVCGYAETLPFAAGAFDAVLSRFSAHHWADLGKGLAEWRRVLRSDGIGIVIDTVAPENAMADSILQSIETLRDPSHMRNYTVSEWRRALTCAGFEIQTITPMRLRLDFASWVARTGTSELHQQAIRSVQSMTSTTVQAHFEMDGDGSFTLDTALFILR